LQTQTLALPALTMLVIGGMVGAGMFSLLRTFAGAVVGIYGLGSGTITI
jgi:hypothetical protein